MTTNPVKSAPNITDSNRDENFNCGERPALGCKNPPVPASSGLIPMACDDEAKGRALVCSECGQRSSAGCVVVGCDSAKWVPAFGKESETHSERQRREFIEKHGYSPDDPIPFELSSDSPLSRDEASSVFGRTWLSRKRARRYGAPQSSEHVMAGIDASRQLIQQAFVHLSTYGQTHRGNDDLLVVHELVKLRDFISFRCSSPAFVEAFAKLSERIRSEATL